MKKICFILFASFSLLQSAPYTLMNKEHDTLSQQFLSKIRKDFAVDTFIETGTYSGKTASQAAKVFSKVHTIEIEPKLYEAAKKRYSKAKNINFILGSSIELLRNYHEMCNGRAVLWLDAHYSGGNTGGIPGLNVVVEELKTLDQLGVEDAIFLIDDLRGMYYLDKRQNSSIRGVVEQIQNLPGEYCFYVLGDIGIAYNRVHHPNIQVSNLVKAVTTSRLFDGQEVHLDEVLKAEELIMSSYRTAEGKELAKLEKIFASSPHPGGEVVYVFWSGLQKLGARKNTEAAKKFQTAITHHCDHQRIKNYLKNTTGQ